jgi:xanthine dehydrogenase accessory factor
MICSGEQTVAFYPLAEKHVQLLGQLSAAMGNPSGLALQFDEFGFSLHASSGHGKPFIRRSATEWTYTEPLDEKPRIIILGAGHVGLALSRTMAQLGFLVHLMDDRAGLNTMAMNQWAHARSVVDYQRIGEVITGDPELYIVLVSFGYRTDALLARQLLRKKFKYLGMMGSAGKIEKLLADLCADGFTEAELSHLRTPIGLPVHSKTPEEIAVSIAAEIIGVKNGAL